MTNRSTRALTANWDDLPSEQVRPGVSRKGFGTDDVILVMNDIQPEMEARPHVHEDFDQIATIISGRAIYYVGEIGHEVGPGSLLVIPAGVEHYIKPVGNEVVKNLDVFAPAREDYRHLLTWADDAL